MDWKRLLEFALLGSGDLEHDAILLGPRLDRVVLRHLRGKQIVYRRLNQTR